MDYFPHIRRKSLGGASEKESSYTIKKKLGSGSYGCVYLTTNNLDGFQYAMKRIETRNIRYKDDYRRLCHEINILFFNRSPYLLHALDVEYNKEQYKVDLVSELFMGGNLDNYIYKYRTYTNDTRIPNDTIWTIFLQAAMGLEYLHRNGIIHRDLKPANILIDHKDKPAKIAICDFGASICLGSNQRNCHTKIGTPYFMSPEQYNSTSYDKRTDVWSLGCILYELITLEKPFQAPNIVMLNYKISKGQYKPISTANGNADLLLWNELIKKMIEKDTTKRIAIGTILQLPEIKAKLKELGLHRQKRPFFDLPLILQNRDVSNQIQLASYIHDVKKELGALNNQNISLTSSLRREYQPSPAKHMEGRPQSDGSLLQKNKLFIPIQNPQQQQQPADMKDQISAFRRVLKPLPIVPTPNRQNIHKPYALRLKNIVEENRKEQLAVPPAL